CYSWVAFQTAWLKANYPAEYMAAVLSRNRANITKLTGFMDECKKMHIPVKGPDVNESYFEFGVDSHGNIRFGLAAIKGVGENVVKVIIDQRREGGRFESIYDFVERVPSSAMNRRVFESLALAGAFDCFSEIKREDFFYENHRGETFSETLVRYGQAYQADKQRSAASLFGEDAELSTSGRPEIVPAMEWVDAEKLEKERELVGMYLSAHPLDPFYMELNYGCSCTIKGYEEFTPVEGIDLTFGGMVVDFISRPARNGGQFGILKIEDYTGSTELRLFGQTYIDFHNYGIAGTPVLVTGQYQRRFANSDLRFNITNIRLLSDVKGKLIRSITIDLPKDKILRHIHDLIVEQVNSATADRGELAFRVFDPSINRSLKLSSGVRIPITRALVDALTEEEIQFYINE
ncbi:MAG: DNA polymerase III subunit alpha, partial [Duncaniella sp.]|nr:DNA polymerase III subunit alpha [Duncaniella sp.]